jgi:hypothetical protein
MAPVNGRMDRLNVVQSARNALEEEGLIDWTYTKKRESMSRSTAGLVDTMRTNPMEKGWDSATAALINSPFPKTVRVSLLLHLLNAFENP